MDVIFEPNPVKEVKNIIDHGISFSTAQEVFNDPNQVQMDNYFYAEDGEQRYVLIGLAHGLALLVVVFVDHSEPPQEIYRLISARKATAYEEGIYEDQFDRT